MTAAPHWTECPECGKPLSSAREKCPQCGADLRIERAKPGALIPCPDCKREISRAAIACPGCGRPLRPAFPTNQRSANSAVIFIAVVVAVMLALTIVSAFCTGMAQRGVHF